MLNLSVTSDIFFFKFIDFFILFYRLSLSPGYVVSFLEKKGDKSLRWRNEDEITRSRKGMQVCVSQL